MPDLTMPFGKYEGKEMTDIPSGYLLWIAENFTQEDICVAADKEWQWREQWNQHWEFDK